MCFDFLGGASVWIEDKVKILSIEQKDGLHTARIYFSRCSSACDLWRATSAFIKTRNPPHTYTHRHPPTPHTDRIWHAYSIIKKGKKEKKIDNCRVVFLFLCVLCKILQKGACLCVLLLNPIHLSDTHQTHTHTRTHTNTQQQQHNWQLS